VGTEQIAATPPPNRTVPKHEPPKAQFELPANPTPRDILRARVFEEPLVPVGGEPSAAENSDLAASLAGYARRSGPDDFSSLTHFLEQHPRSPWAASLLSGLGLEYYNTAHYSLALEAWKEAWSLTKGATDARGKAVGDRAAGELACMYARLGRMAELQALLKSVEGRVFMGPATEKITGGREGLWNMQHRPEISFRCGPMALQRIVLSSRGLQTSSATNALKEIFSSVSTQNGFSLTQLAELSKKVGLNYQMAYRPMGASARLAGQTGDFVVPSVVHWKVGHYAALLRQEGERYLLEDPTFGSLGNTVWATKQALEAEASGYFLVPPGPLPTGWRTVETQEGETVWGKGVVNNSDPRPHGCSDQQTGGSDPCHDPCGGSPGGGGDGGSGGGPGGGSSGPTGGGGGNPLPSISLGMAKSSVHLMLVNLNLRDTPVGYSPPLGPPVEFTVRYNHREAFQPTIFTYANFGSKWTCDWISYITDSPSNTLANVNYFIRGGGTRTFNSFDTNSQTYAFQQMDQTQLTRTGPASYEMLWPDGSKLIFGQSDGSVGTSRKIFLTQVLDPYGNAATLSYDVNLRLLTISDALGQVTTLTYGDPSDIYKITKVTDPFGRFATFDYDPLGRLTNITDVIGLTSRFSYETNGDFVNALTTPYGTTTFLRADIIGGNSNPQIHWLETHYPDGSRDRVEFNESSTLGIPDADPASSVPQGMTTLVNRSLFERNTYYWSRNACSSSYGDYTKAKVYHWFHSSELISTGVSIPESIKEPLEGRVWFDYAGQNFSTYDGSSNRPQHAGRVLDDGSTQLYTYAYNGFGHLTNVTDSLGRTFSYIYATNGIDLLEVRMTRAGKNELLSRATYNAQHLPLTTTDAAGQTTTYTYNPRGQLLTATNPKNETTSYTYDTNGYLIAVDGPLPGTNDVVTATYDAYGRVRTKTDVSGYTVTLDYDAIDRVTRITHPDSTFEQFTYYRLEPSVLQDRAGRQTLLEYDAFGQLIKRTDPLGRETLFEWCSCGDIKSLTDAMARTTTWHKDVQDRLITKQFGDGSQVTYTYEKTTSRLQQVVDEKLQVKSFFYNVDNTVRLKGYANATVPTPAVSYTYDPDYPRITSMTDGIGTTVYQYVPVRTPPVLGTGKLASINGPLPNDTIEYTYDELGREVSTAINGVAATTVFDAAGRLTSESNALGSFSYSYDGSSGRIVSEIFPNGQTSTASYGTSLQDFSLQQLTHQAGSTPISRFRYGRDIPAARITTWSQEFGAQPPLLYTFGYDAANQLLFGTLTTGGSLLNGFSYTYDPTGNRLSEQAGGATNLATYNALNQLSTCVCGPGPSRTNEWDAEDRLASVNSVNQRTEFTYDGLGQLFSIRQLTNGAQASYRRLVWCDDRICEERDASGLVTKRFFQQGTKLETGANAGRYYYTRDHLGSLRELTDSNGAVRARYSYDPFGRRTRLTGDLDAEFAFAGRFHAAEAELDIARYRAYEPGLGRWLSRDPLPDAEMVEGPNLYAYTANNPVNRNDLLGLCCEDEKKAYEEGKEKWGKVCGACRDEQHKICSAETSAGDKNFYNGPRCREAEIRCNSKCYDAYNDFVTGPLNEYLACLEKCKDPKPQKCKKK
jgi:RHS repeat-associated protein